MIRQIPQTVGKIVKDYDDQLWEVLEFKVLNKVGDYYICNIFPKEARIPERFSLGRVEIGDLSCKNYRWHVKRLTKRKSRA